MRDSVARKYSKLGIEIIAESEPMPTGPLVAGPGTSPAVIDSIKGALLALNPGDPDHKRILQRLDEDLKSGFTVATDADQSLAVVSLSHTSPSSAELCLLGSPAQVYEVLESVDLKTWSVTETLTTDDRGRATFAYLVDSAPMRSYRFRRGQGSLAP